MRKLKENFLVQLFVIYTRYLVGGAFVFASVVKIMGYRFTSTSGENHPIHSAWHFFETLYQSGLYWQFIGVMQLLAGCLLMTQRFARLGLLLLLPIAANIAFITYSYDFNYTPIITTMMLLACLMLLVWDWNIFRILINPAARYEPGSIKPLPTFEHEKVWEVTGIVLFLFTFSYRLSDTYNFLFWMSGCIAIGFTGLLAGVTKKRKLNRNVSIELIA